MVKALRLFLSQYYFVTPLFYSFGNAAEEIYWASARARLLGKKLIILRPIKFTQILNYSIFYVGPFCITAIFSVLFYPRAVFIVKKVLKLRSFYSINLVKIIKNNFLGSVPNNVVF